MLLNLQLLLLSRNILLEGLQEVQKYLQVGVHSILLQLDRYILLSSDQ